MPRWFQIIQMQTSYWMLYKANVNIKKTQRNTWSISQTLFLYINYSYNNNDESSSVTELIFKNIKRKK